MLKYTFCHLPGITVKDERVFWHQCLRGWDDLLCYGAARWSDDRYAIVRSAIESSYRALERNDISFFLSRLPASEHGRVYPDFREHLLFLDIETTGLAMDDPITVLSILRCGEINSYVRGRDLQKARAALCSAAVVVTFHGTGFDIPRLRKEFPAFAPAWHIDLADLFAARQERARLKVLAERYGILCCDVKIWDGSGAAKAWQAFAEAGDEERLAVLVEYNQQDVLLLPKLLEVLHSREFPTSR